MSSYLSKHGYVIRKDSLDPLSLSSLKSELIAKPLSNDTVFKSSIQSFPVYIETRNKIYIPKIYGINRFGPTKELPDFLGHSIPPSKLHCTLVLYDNQLEPVNLLLSSLLTTGGGILSLNVGGGKTASTIYVLSKLAGKTIVVVNKIPLMHQWVDEIHKFLPHVKVGTLQGQKNIDILDCDIVIAMLQSLVRIDYPSHFFENFSVTVLDECHNYSSRIFSSVMFKLTSKYTIGLSATPYRADGCDYVIGWHIGDVVYKSTQAVRDGKPPLIKFIKLDSSDYIENYSVNPYTGLKTLQFTSMLSHLVQMKNRNLLILDIIKDTLSKYPARKLLVLSDRRSHLQSLSSLLDLSTNISFTYGLCLGNMKKKDFDLSRSTNCIFATFSAFSEGVSEQNLDTLFLISPKKYVDESNKHTVKRDSGKLNQIIGRIFRKDHLLIHPMIIDLSDNFSVYKSHFNSRKIFYKKNLPSAIYESYSINLDTSPPLVSHLLQQNPPKQSSTHPSSNITSYCLLD